MKLTLGFSSCPNDTFIFDAMIHGKVDTEGLDFDIVITDVEDLNKRILEEEIDISKISFHAYACAAKKYILLTSGSALGRKNGPLLISKHKIYPDEVKNIKVAYPGKYTTANLLFSIEFPEVKEKKEYVFSDIEDAVLYGEVDAGVIIHENRFTYQQKGLKKVVDLGENWEDKTGNPIPLGGIAIRREIEDSIQRKVNSVLKRSILFASENPDSSYSFVKIYAKEMKDTVIRKHIELYVNEFTVDLGNEGKKAVRNLYDLAAEKGILHAVNGDIFIG